MASQLPLFQLVISPGLGDSTAVGIQSQNFWTTRLSSGKGSARTPGFVTRAEVLTPHNTSIAWGSLGLSERALLLLEHIQNHRARLNIKPEDNIPCVFLCHEIGGALVKQALLLAAQDPKYSFLAYQTALVVLQDTPASLENLSAWESKVGEILSRSDLNRTTAVDPLKHLPSALEEVSWKFRGIERHYNIVDLKGKSYQSPGINDWRFYPGERMTEEIWDMINPAVRRFPKDFMGMMHNLSKVHPLSHQLRLGIPVVDFVSRVIQHATFASWKALDPKSPNILYMHGRREFVNTQVASDIFFNLQEEFRGATIITYSFSQQDVETQHITTLWTSLIRQLLLTDRHLFRRIGLIHNVIETERILSYEIVRDLLLTLLRISMKPIVCVIHGVENRGSFPIEEVITLAKKYRRLSSGIFKVLVLDGPEENDIFSENPKICCTMSISEQGSNDNNAPLNDAVYRSERMNTLLSGVQQSLWPRPDLLHQVMARKLNPGPEYAALEAWMVETTKMPSTRSAATSNFATLPNTFEEMYEKALERCQSHSGLPLRRLLHWISHVVRPITLKELATITGLINCQEPRSITALMNEVPRFLGHDLRLALGSLVEKSGLQILPYYPIAARNSADDDPDFDILSTCLDYLELILFSESSCHSDDFPPAAQLMDYAVLEWPQHYRRIRAGSLRDRVFKFFSEKRVAEKWFEHYRKLANFPDNRFAKLDSLLKIASWFGLADLAACAIEQLKEEEEKGKKAKVEEPPQVHLKNALDLAAMAGHDEVVALLLEANAQSSRVMALAAEGGFLSIVQKLHEARPGLMHQTDSFGRPALILAALSGNKEISTYLLERGAEIDVVVATSTRPLHLAAQIGNTAVVRLLLDAGANVNAGNSHDMTALHIAVAGGFDQLVQLLIRRGGGIDGTTDAGMTALHFAVENGQASTMDILLKSGSNIHAKTKTGSCPIHLAAREGFLEILQRLIEEAGRHEEAAPESCKVEKPLDISIQSTADGDQDKSDREDGNEEDSEEEELGPNCFHEADSLLCPMQLAAKSGHVDIVRELLKHNQYSSSDARAKSLLLAAREGFAAIVKELLKTGITTAFFDTDRRTALHLAISQDHSDIVEQLLRLLESNSDEPAIFDVRAKDNHNWTPLHIAAKSGRLGTGLSSLLLRGKIPLDEVTESSQTVFHIAAEYGHSAVFQTFLTYLQYNMNQQQERKLFSSMDRTGSTPLILAIDSGHDGIVEVILQRFSSPTWNIQSLEGEEVNALASAVKWGYWPYPSPKSMPSRPGPPRPGPSRGTDKVFDKGRDINSGRIVKLLLDKGWDINSTKGETALNCSIEQENIGMVEMLLRHGADPNILDWSKGASLHRAVRRDSVRAVRALLKHKGTNINLVDYHGDTPLHVAARGNKYECMGELLRGSPDLEIGDDTGWTALHAAYEHPRIAKLLIDSGANPMALADCDLTPFMLLADEPNGQEALQFYIDAKVDLNAQQVDGKTAFHIAASGWNLEALKLLDTNGCDINAVTDDGKTALHYAAYAGSLEAVCYLLERNLDVNYNMSGTPLMEAARGEEAEVAKLLLAHGAHVNATNDESKSCSALQAAALEGHLETVKVLLKAGADPNIVGGSYGSALCAVIKSDSDDAAEVLHLLLDAGADIDYAEGPKGTALEYALARGESDLADLCLERGANVNIVSKGKHGTPLVAAVHRDDIDHGVVLLERGADPNLSRPETGESPAEAVILRGRQEMLELILEKGARLDFRNGIGCGPLSYTIKSKSLDLLPYLWGRKDVEINEKDAVGRTPLMIAALEGVSVVQDLHRHGANLDLQDQWGKTALMHAIIHDYPSLAAELIAFGADVFPRDTRGRGALYWASRRANLDTFDSVLQKLKQWLSPETQYQEAINAAVATNSQTYVERLLKEIRFDARRADVDGWTAAHTALRYGDDDMQQLIKEAFKDSGQLSTEPLATAKMPTEWNQLDMSPGLAREPNATSLCLSKTYRPVKTDDLKCVTRANHPMWPQKDGVYYFEITVSEDPEDTRLFSVGFCEEHTSLWVPLGSVEGSWGYAGDNGRIYGPATGDKGARYGLRFGKGDVVGCGVNFDKQTAFYTLNGQIIGQAFCDVKGKLFPAVCVDVRSKGCVLSAKFWEGGPDAKQDFKFNGRFEDEESSSGSECTSESGSYLTSSDDG